MISKDFLTEWRQFAPWTSDGMIEQDLVMSRVLIELYSIPEIAKQFAFRGGTALTKLFLPTPVRYSEDIDLVQVSCQPIGKYLDMMRDFVDPWLGEPERNRKQGTINLIYRFDTEGFENRKSRLKIEINSREHFTVFGYQKKLLKVNSRWFSGEANILTYSLEELLGTKMRALYQRRKGRDLFDLWMGLKVCKADPKRILETFQAYMGHQKVKVSRKDFLENFSLKMQNNNFILDMQALLTEGVNYNLREAADLVIDQLIDRIK